eukprot:TRINITY_DN9966_c0_g1_i1.p1 TRINITY_DN9966_c0_g1~~TRINITY_DN9966_c0_g1_i1.p1  ORF type:complete len:170 (-),score=8.00 TRINITY_DN9966_c0_g1_i1:72-581(-)
MEFTTTEKGSLKILKDGYIYVYKKKLANDLRTFECILRRKGSQCNSTIKINNKDEFVSQNNEHTHAPSQTEAQVTLTTANIRRRAEETMDTPQQILSAELRCVNDDVAANLPAITTMKRNIRKVRKKNELPPNPLSREEIVDIPEILQQTHSKERFFCLIVAMETKIAY